MIPLLEQQLHSAVQRQRRWNALRDEMHTHDAIDALWKLVSTLQDAEIQHLSTLLLAAEYQRRRGMAN